MLSVVIFGNTRCKSIAAEGVVAAEYDASRNTFRIGSVTEQSADDASRPTSTYERTDAELPGKTAAATVRAPLDSGLLCDLVTGPPDDTRVRLDIADAHPLRLKWPNTHSAQGDSHVEVTAFLAPREVPTRDDDTEQDAAAATTNVDAQ